MKFIYLAVISILLAAAFIYFEHEKKYVPAVVLKGLASLFFVILGILGWKMNGSPDYGKFVVTGLVLGCVADVLLNLRFVFEKIGSKIFLVGILVFLSGHIFYIVGLFKQCYMVWIFILAGAFFTFFILRWIFSKITAKKAFKIFGVFYIGAVVIMTCIALGVLATNPCARNAVFFAGAVLFLISDIVLILNTFGGTSKFSLRITNLSLYYLGQILIALTLQLP